MSTVTRGLIGGLVTTAVLTGCSRGPVLTESAGRLESDARAVLEDTAGRLATPGTKVGPLDEHVRPCASGQSRKLLHGRVPLRRGPSSAFVVDRAAEVALALISQRGYRLVSPPRVGRTRRAFTMTRDAPAATLTVRLHGGKDPTLDLNGTTPCLPA